MDKKDRQRLEKRNERRRLMGLLATMNQLLCEGNEHLRGERDALVDWLDEKFPNWQDDTAGRVKVGL